MTEKTIVRRMLAALAKQGFTPVSVNDGGDELVRVSTTAATIDAVFAVGVARIYFERDAKHVGSVLLVIGNGDDIVSDWSWDDRTESGRAFNTALDAFIATLGG